MPRAYHNIVREHRAIARKPVMPRAFLAASERDEDGTFRRVFVIPVEAGTHIG
jgi:hypothetical protein